MFFVSYERLKNRLGTESGAGLLDEPQRHL